MITYALTFVLGMAPLMLCAQLQVCITGGAGDGHASACGSNLASGISHSGGTGDGHAVQCGASVGSGVAYGGGMGDGHAKDCGGTAANNTIFAGSAGDGWNVSCGAQPSNNALFAGGTGDGTDAWCGTTPTTNLTFVGGADDGWDVGSGTVSFNALRIQVLLEGPYDPLAGLMRDDLRFLGFLPANEPYSAIGSPPIGHLPGTVSSSVFDVTGPDAIVDWIQLELRAPSDLLQPVARVDALVQRDGDVVATDGVGPVVFMQAAGNYFVVIRHRNHLAAMSAIPLALSCAPTPMDLTGTGALFGTQPTKNIGGTEVLWAGNTNSDGQLKYTGTNNDRDPILLRIGGSVPTNTVMGYFREDVNMDGTVKYTGAANDRDPILVNIGGTVPTSTRVQQVP